MSSLTSQDILYYGAQVIRWLIIIIVGGLVGLTSIDWIYHKILSWYARRTAINPPNNNNNNNDVMTSDASHTNNRIMTDDGDISQDRHLSSRLSARIRQQSEAEIKQEEYKIKEEERRQAAIAKDAEILDFNMTTMSEMKGYRLQSDDEPEGDNNDGGLRRRKQPPKDEDQVRKEQQASQDQVSESVKEKQKRIEDARKLAALEKAERDYGWNAGQGRQLSQTTQKILENEGAGLGLVEKAQLAAKQAEYEEDRIEREAQDAEYEAYLLADQLRQAEIEKRANMLEKLKVKRETLRRAKEKCLPRELEVGEQGVVEVGISLPDSTRISYRFSETCAISSLYDLVDARCSSLSLFSWTPPSNSSTYSSIDQLSDSEFPSNYKLLQLYPRQEFLNLKSTLKEAGLHRKVLLIVKKVESKEQEKKLG